MSIDRLNAAAWAAGFAMAPIDDEPVEPAKEAVPEPEKAQTSRWRAALPSATALVPVEPAAMRQWLTSWQRKATA